MSDLKDALDLAYYCRGSLIGGAAYEYARACGVLGEHIKELEKQRDELLAALKSTNLFLHHCWCDVQMNEYSFGKLNQQMIIVDKAISSIEKG